MTQPPSDLLENEQIREELVAYLDGELDSAEALRVERRLAEDPAYRQALQELEKAWDLLDVLPRAQVDEDFTRTTVEMVALSAAQEVEKVQRGWERRRRAAVIGSAAAVLAAALAGFGAVYWTSTRSNRELVRDLPVIENMEYYRHAESLEYLRRLDQVGLFEDEVSDAISP
jgi:anti-sigma factor RsiW